MQDRQPDLLLMANMDKFPASALPLMKRQLQNFSYEEMFIIFSSCTKNPTNVFILSFFLGGIGVDRFYIGDIGIGILKLITSFLILPWLIDLFLISNATRKKNYEKFLLLTSHMTKSSKS